MAQLDMFTEEPLSRDKGRMNARQACDYYGYDYQEILDRLAEFRRKRDSYVAPRTKPIKRIEIDWSPGRKLPQAA